MDGGRWTKYRASRIRQIPRWEHQERPKLTDLIHHGCNKRRSERRAAGGGGFGSNTLHLNSFDGGGLLIASHSTLTGGWKENRS